MAQRLSLVCVLLIALVLAPRAALAQTDYYVYLSCSSDDLVYGPANSEVSCVSTNDRGWTMYDLNGGSSVADGDVVTFETSNFANWRIITVGGTHSGAPLDVDDSMASYDEYAEFIIENLDCDNCDIVDGTRVSLQNVATGDFWTAASCGGGYVNGTATSRGTCETFEISGDLPQ